MRSINPYRYGSEKEEIKHTRHFKHIHPLTDNIATAIQVLTQPGRLWLVEMWQQTERSQDRPEAQITSTGGVKK